MRYIKTYEGFFSKVKDLLIRKEEPTKVINDEEIEILLKDCFVELEDNGFKVVIESSKSNMRSMPTGVVYYDEKQITEFVVHIDKEDNRSFLNGRVRRDYTRDYIDFEINQIRDAVLFSIDTMKDKSGSSAECYYKQKIYTIDRGYTFADEMDSTLLQKGKSIKTSYDEVENSNWTISEFAIKFSI